MASRLSTSNVTIDWPASLGPIDEIEPIGFGGDGRSIDVARTTDDGTDLLRIADPIGRAVSGRLADPSPRLVVHLPGRDLRIDVSPDGAWATVVDRLDDVHVVRLADGRSWPIDRDRTILWADAP